jgi:hypothetical protein
MLAALLLWAAVTLPAFAIHRWLYVWVPPPSPPAKWSAVIPIALDLDVPLIPTVIASTRNWTQWSAVLALLLAIIAAARQGNRAALALLGCVIVIPAAWLAGDYRLHAFQGILYPLGLAGVALLVGSVASRRWIVAVAALVVFMGVLRIPQHLATGGWYLYAEIPQLIVLRQSEAETLRATVANDGVDVWLPTHVDNHFAMTELLARGTHVQLQGLAWRRTLGEYLPPQTPPGMISPKARFSLVDRDLWSSLDRQRWVGSRWKLIEDGPTISMLSLTEPLGYICGNPPQRGVWLGTAPSELLIHNGTGRIASIQLHALFISAPARCGKHDVFRFSIGADTGSLTMTEDEMRSALPLKIQPGLNRIQLWVETSDASNPPRTLLGFGDWRIEMCDAAPTKE